MKIKTVRIIVILLIFLFLGSTGTLHVSSEADTIFSPHCTIAVSCKSNDPLSIQQQLENLLVSKGFNVISERLARIKVNMQNRPYASVESKEGTVLERSKEKPSVYILRFSYEYSVAEIYSDYMFNKFSASLIDLRDGGVVASEDFSQSSFGAKPVSNVLEDLLNKLTDLS